MKRVCQRPRVAWAFAVATLVALQAFAQVTVYHSPGDDGVNPGSPVTLSTLGPEWLYLYLYIDRSGSATTIGTPCLDGNGKEL